LAWHNFDSIGNIMMNKKKLDFNNRIIRNHKFNLYY
jgi:hypothetical protein